MAYSLEIREKALDYLERCGSVPEVSKSFGVSQHTIRAWQRLKGDTGSLAKKPIDCSKRRRKIDDEVLRAYLDEHPDAYLSEMADLFSCSVNAVHKKLKSMNISRKKRPRLTANKTPKKQTSI